MSLIDSYDCVLLDLDGVVYLGKTPIENAVKTIKELQKRKVNIAVITNNGSVTAKSVSKWMKDFGLDLKASSIVTSSQTLCWYLKENYPKSSKVLVVGSDGLKESLTEAGFKVVTKADKEPVVVVNGIDADIAQKDLAEMCYAISKGVAWVSTNGDYTFPTEKGLAPGNGAFNALITFRSLISVGVSSNSVSLPNLDCHSSKSTASLSFSSISLSSDNVNSFNLLLISILAACISLYLVVISV
jgi:HAD superfamily hydrolase (TIGR01450 family)